MGAEETPRGSLSAGQLGTLLDSPMGKESQSLAPAPTQGLVPSPPRKAPEPKPATPSHGKATPSILEPPVLDLATQTPAQDVNEAPMPSPNAKMSRSPNTKTPRSPNSKDISALAKSVRKTPKKHALTDAQVEAAVPDLHGESAPKPELGKAQISEQAVRMRSQRIFRRRTNGSLKVSEEIFNEWHARGARRDMLEEIFLQVGYDPAAGPSILYRCILLKS